MAQFQGFACDSCGAVGPSTERTRKTVRFEGPTINGEFNQDLCKDCLPDPTSLTLKPLRRRKKGDDEVEPEVPEDALASS